MPESLGLVVIIILLIGCPVDQQNIRGWINKIGYCIYSHDFIESKYNTEEITSVHTIIF